jgi:hypothetical protein
VGINIISGASHATRHAGRPERGIAGAQSFTDPRTGGTGNHLADERERIAILGSVARQQHDRGERTGARRQAERASHRVRATLKRDVFVAVLPARAGVNLRREGDDDCAHDERSVHGFLKR